MVEWVLTVQRGEKRDTRNVKLPATKAHSRSCPADCAACQALIGSSLDWLAAQARGYRASRNFDCFDRGPFYAAKLLNGVKTYQSRPYTVAVTSVAGLAFLAAGETPLPAARSRPASKDSASGAHAQVLGVCRDYVAMAMGTWQKPAEEAGGAGEQQYENWALGYAGLFLSECLARDPQDTKLKETLGWIAQRLGQNQEESGGWAHKPRTVCNMGYKEFAAPALVILPALGRTAGVIWAFSQAGVSKDEASFRKGADFFMAHPEWIVNGHDSQMMNLVWGGWGAAMISPEALERMSKACRYIAWAARRPDGSFAPWPSREWFQVNGQWQERFAALDTDTEKFLGLGEAKAVSVWIAAHQLLFWQTPQRQLSWLKEK